MAKFLGLGVLYWTGICLLALCQWGLTATFAWNSDQLERMPYNSGGFFGLALWLIFGFGIPYLQLLLLPSPPGRVLGGAFVGIFCVETAVMIITGFITVIIKRRDPRYALANYSPEYARVRRKVLIVALLCGFMIFSPVVLMGCICGWSAKITTDMKVIGIIWGFTWLTFMTSYVKRHIQSTVTSKSPSRTS